MTKRSRWRSAERRSPLFGRDADLDLLERLIDEGAALVTLTGPPGIGKSAQQRAS